MKHSLLYIAAAALAASAALSSCDDNFTHPPVITPPCIDVEPSMPLLDFKTEYWSALSTPTEIPYYENGDTLILTGRVCSSDESGNIFKSIVIQSVDEEGNQTAVNLSVNSYDLYKLFPYGQEVAVYASGMTVGGYRNLFQFGAANESEMTFMDVDFFKAHVTRNGSALPEPEKVDIFTTTIADINAAKADNTTLMKWQSRLIRIDNVEFVDAGQPCAPTQTMNRYVRDADGNRINVRCSSYSSFKNELLPYGTGSVVGILSYYNNDWQILLNGWDGLIDFDGEAPEPVEPVDPAGEGTLESPYNVAKVLELIRSGNNTDSEVYIKGIVSDISEIGGSYGNATYTIVDKKGLEAFTIFRGYYLNGDKFTSADQLKAGDEVVVLGKLINYNGTPETAQGSKIISINGQGGATPPASSTAPAGEGTSESPYNVAKALEVIASGNIPATEVHVKGIITTIDEIDTGNFGNATYKIADSKGETEFLIYRGYWLEGAKFTSADQLKAGAEVVVLGKLINFMNNTPEMEKGNKIVSYNGEGGTTGGDTPAPVADYTCAKVNAITSGDTYVLVVDSQFGAAIAASSSFGRLSLTDAAMTAGTFDVAAANVITITEEAGKGYTLKDSFGRYLSMDNEHPTAFQLYTDLKDGCYWDATFDTDGKLKLTNKLATDCFVCVSKGTEGTYYTNIAPAKAPAEFKLPELYKATKK